MHNDIAENIYQIWIGKLQSALFDFLPDVKYVNLFFT